MKTRTRRILRDARRFAALPGAKRRLIPRAMASILAVEWDLRRLGFRWLVEKSEQASRGSHRPVGPEEIARARGYAHWINVAARYSPVRARCLHQALVLHRWLVAENLPSYLHIGVRKEHDELKAHAWVELGGQVLDEEPTGLDSFTVLARTGFGQRLTAGRAAPRPEPKPAVDAGPIADGRRGRRDAAEQARLWS